MLESSKVRFFNHPPTIELFVYYISMYKSITIFTITILYNRG